VKTIQNVKNSLKFKAQEKEGVLTVKVGVRKYCVPVKARMLSGDHFLFLSFPASSELYEMTDNSLLILDNDDQAEGAYEALNPAKPRQKGKAGTVEMPSELADALKKIPAGVKVGYNEDGSPKLVRTRRRSK
jgi:hypothetical protein